MCRSRKLYALRRRFLASSFPPHEFDFAFDLFRIDLLIVFLLVA
jgi:hypothetical protein